MSAASREQILAVVVDVLENEFEKDPSKITLQTHLFTDLDLDSLDAIDLAAALSKKAQIKLATEEMKEIRTVGDVVEIGFRKLTEGR
jgi:acyl carrier protein